MKKGEGEEGRKGTRVCAMGVQLWNNLESTYHKVFYRFSLLCDEFKWEIGVISET